MPVLRLDVEPRLLTTPSPSILRQRSTESVSPRTGRRRVSISLPEDEDTDQLQPSSASNMLTAVPETVLQAEASNISSQSAHSHVPFSPIAFAPEPTDTDLVAAVSAFVSATDPVNAIAVVTPARGDPKIHAPLSAKRSSANDKPIIAEAETVSR